MEAQESTTVFLLKVWPWVETNRNRLIGGAVAIVIVVFVVWFFVWKGEQREIDAGQALSQAVMAPGGPTADVYLKVATDHPDTAAGQRALLDAATELFTDGRYTESQAQFQKFLDSYPDSEFFGEAALGVAVSLDAQNKPDLAADAYQRVLRGTSDTASINAAKFGLAGIDAAQGHLDEALVYYQDVARGNPGISIGAEAGLRALELRNQMPAPASPAVPAAPAPATPPAASQSAPFPLTTKP
jgi:predicted negative regulator of RcsB-dependent stress response